MTVLRKKATTVLDHAGLRSTASATEDGYQPDWLEDGDVVWTQHRVLFDWRCFVGTPSNPAPALLPGNPLQDDVAKDLYFSAPFFQAVAARYCAVHAFPFCEFLGCHEPVAQDHKIVIGDAAHEYCPHGFAQDAGNVPMYWRLPRGTVVNWSLRDLLQKRRGDFDEPCERRHYEYVAANFLPRFLSGRYTIPGFWEQGGHC